MLSASEWRKNLENMIKFVLIDGSGLEVTGLADGFDVFISKADGPFIPSTGVKAEIGMGWYSYIATGEESNTSGPVAVVIQSPSTIQQNLEYVVDDRVVSGVEFEYTVTSTAGNVPIQDVVVEVYADALMTSVVWTGRTDSSGVARDAYGYLPRLTPGNYFFYRNKSGYAFSNPDMEAVG